MDNVGVTQSPGRCRFKGGGSDGNKGTDGVKGLGVREERLRMVSKCKVTFSMEKSFSVEWTGSPFHSRRVHESSNGNRIRFISKFIGTEGRALIVFVEFSFLGQTQVTSITRLS